MTAMRIVLTSNYSPWSSYSGGGQRSTHNLATALASRGHDVTVVFTRPPWESVPVPAALPYAVRWATLLSVGGRSPGPLRLTSAPTVARVIAELTAMPGPTVVHSQGEEAALLPALRRLRRFGLVVTPRYPSFPTALTGFARRSVRERVRFAGLETKYLALGVALRGADVCCPPSRFGGELIRAAYELPSSRIVPVHNGIPAEFLSYHHRAATSDAELRARPLVFFGRFVPDKGVGTVIDAVARTRDASAVLVGGGPLADAMRSRVRDLGLASRIRFVDWASHDEIGALLSGAAAAVLPSHAENFSLAVLAALAVGVPLVTTPVGGTPEIVVDGDNGLLVPVGDAAALASAIGRVRGDVELARRLGERGRAVAREGYTWAAAASRFEAIYDRVRR